MGSAGGTPRRNSGGKAKGMSKFHSEKEGTPTATPEVKHPGIERQKGSEYASNAHAQPHCIPGKDQKAFVEGK